MRELDAIVTRAHATEPKVPAYEGGKFPLSTYLAERVRRLLAEPGSWSRLPDQVSDWLRFQADVSIVPGPDEILVETFPRGHKLKRSFGVCAIISGLIERRHPGQEKSGRQMTVSWDLIYDVLRQHEPDHILLRAVFADAATGLIDVGRLNQFLQRICGRIRHIALSQVSPLAVPAMLEIRRESVAGEASETLLRETVEELIAEAFSGHAQRKA